ncbi:egg-laying defective protein 27 [Ditylenchus destructor]|nr:egg-laying defective protein 27 [Ditylenchus destructor]
MTTGVGANSTGGVVVDCAQTAINAEVAGTSGQSAVENLENQSSTGIEQQSAKPKRPHEYTSGEWEVEPFYYSTTSSNSYNTNGTASPANNGSRNSYANGDDVTQSAKRNRRGMVYKSRDDYEYKCFQDYEGTIYRLGDHVYVDSLQPSDPYLVGCILMFKMVGLHVL